MATLCVHLFSIYLPLLPTDMCTFAKGAVWSPEVHQAGDFGRVAQVGHHGLLSAMKRLICRGGKGAGGGRQHRVTLEYWQSCIS